MKLVKIGKLVHIAEIPWFWFGLKARAACHTRGSASGKSFEARGESITCGRCKRAYGVAVKRVVAAVQPEHDPEIPKLTLDQVEAEVGKP
jgi:hypothetical protein